MTDYCASHGELHWLSCIAAVRYEGGRQGRQTQATVAVSRLNFVIGPTPAWSRINLTHKTAYGLVQPYFAQHDLVYTQAHGRAVGGPSSRSSRPTFGSDKAMAIHQPHTKNSINLTLKVVQFVNQLRRRLKPRLEAPNYPSALGTETCLGLESKAFRTLAKGLSRFGLQDKKSSNHASDRVCKSRNKHKTRPTLKLQTPGQDDPAIQNISGGEVQQYVY